MGFNMLFYIIFGTNLLTGGPVLVVFLPISVFRRKGISNGIQTERNLHEDLSWNKRNPEDLELKYGTPRGGHEPGGRAPTLIGPMELHRHTSFAYIYSYTLKTSGGAMKPLFHRRNLCTREIPSGAFSGDLPKGESIMEGFYINTIASPMKRE